MKDGIPNFLELPNGGRLNIEQRRGLKPDEWGFVDTSTTSLVINKDLSRVAKHTVLLREVLVIANNMLRGEGVFVDSAPIIVLFFLTQLGFYGPLSHASVKAYIADPTDAG